MNNNRNCIKNKENIKSIDLTYSTDRIENRNSIFSTSGLIFLTLVFKLTNFLRNIEIF